MPRSVLKDPDIVRAVCARSSSLREVLTSLGVTPGGASASVLKATCLEHGIEVPRGQKLLRDIDDEDFFARGTSYQGKAIKARLLRLGRELVCSLCSLGATWNGLPTTLQLDHIDGDNTNNLLENLRFLCPNCHSQTETFGSRLPSHMLNHCLDCGKRLGGRYSKRCVTCFRKSERIFNKPDKIAWPPVENLLSALEEKTFTELGRELGVSDNAVRKHLRKLGVAVPKKRTVSEGALPAQGSNLEPPDPKSGATTNCASRH